MAYLSVSLRASKSAAGSLFRGIAAPMFGLAVFAGTAAWAAPPETLASQAPPATVQTDVILMFAVDMSASVDEEEALFQREAYAQALENPTIIAIATSGQRRSTALGYMEWSGPFAQVMHVPVHLLREPADFHAMAARIRALGSARGEVALLGSRTAIGDALVAAQHAIEQSGISAPSRIIDISGDGQNNAGLTPTLARDRVVAAGITINALPIGTSPRHTEDLEAFYRQHVIGGTGSFAMVAAGFADVADTLLMKMQLEFVRGLAAGSRHAATARGAPRTGLRIASDPRDRRLP